MSISKYLIKNVATVNREATIEEAIDVMRSFRVDDLIVIEQRRGRPYPLGFISSYDIVLKAYQERQSECMALVRDIMSMSEPVTCEEGQTIFDTISLMQKYNVKRLPVVDDEGALVGVITASDLLSYGKYGRSTFERYSDIL
jgi:CBS domain-containing protein